MLHRLVPVCVSADAPFKVVADPSLHGFQNSKRYSRGGSGKFATVYPRDDGHFVDLIAKLDEATQGLEGPYILSDKRYRDSKVIFYRYGGFQRIRELKPDGTHRLMIRTPQDGLVADDRRPYFSLPDWVSDPLETDPTEDEGGSDLLNDRYKVERALAFSNTGGVYLATDQVGGGTVVIKEARPHTLTWGERDMTIDAITALRNEYACLKKLSGLACVPDVIELYQEWEHIFLVESYFDGIPLGEFRASEDFIVMSSMDDPAAIERFSAVWRDICIGLLDAIEAIHEGDVIVGDISPGNVLIDPATRKIFFIDLEGARLSQAGAEISRFGTQWFNPGFRKPENRGLQSLSRFDDFYACGMLLYNLVAPIQSLFELDKNHPRFRILDHFVDAGLPVEISRIIHALLEGRNDDARREAEGWQAPGATGTATLDQTLTYKSAGRRSEASMAGVDV